MAKQVEAVRTALGPDLVDLPIRQVICFVDADWSLFARPLRFGDVHVLWPRELGKLLRAEGRFDSETVVRVEQRLALSLPPAD